MPSLPLTLPLILSLVLVNDLVVKYKQQKAGSAKRKCDSSDGQKALDIVSSLTEEGRPMVVGVSRCQLISLWFTDLPKVLEVVQERLKQKEEVVSHQSLLVCMLRSAGQLSSQEHSSCC